MPEPVNVFLSYVERDRDIVSKLYTDLKNAGFAPWMADKDLLPGAVVQDAIAKAMQNAHVFLFCLSSALWDDTEYLDSYADQIQMAFNILSNKPSDQFRIIPILLNHEKYQLLADLRKRQDDWRPYSNAFIPLERCAKEITTKLFKFQPVKLHENYDQGLVQIIKSLEVLSDHLNGQSSTSTDVLTKKNHNFQLSKIELFDIRCWLTDKRSLQNAKTTV